MFNFFFNKMVVLKFLEGQINQSSIRKLLLRDNTHTLVIYLSIIVNLIQR